MILTNYDAIPECMRQLRQFCARVQKQPFVRGKKGLTAKSWPKHPENWLTFEEALGAVDRKELVNFEDKPHPVEAIGFLMYRAPQAALPVLIGGDIDCCVDPQTLELSTWASNFLLLILPFYVEISPSRCGIRFFIMGNIDRNKLVGDGPQNDMTQETKERIFAAKPGAFAKFNKGLNVFNTLELYESGRHLSLTGDRLPEYCFPNEDRTLPILKAVAKFMDAEPKVLEKGENANRTASLPHIDIMDVIDTSKFTQSGGQLLGPHPTLGSTTGKNVVVNPEAGIYCYMHDGLNKGGDAWEWLACECGAIPWELAGTGMLKDRRLVEKVLQHAVSRGLISEKEAEIDLQTGIVKVDLASAIGSFGMLESNGTIVRIMPNKMAASKRSAMWMSDCALWVDTETKCDGVTDYLFKGKGAKDGRDVEFTLSSTNVLGKEFWTALTNNFGTANEIGELEWKHVQRMSKNVKVFIKVKKPAWDGTTPLIPGYEPNKNMLFELSTQTPVRVLDGDIEDAKNVVRNLFKIHKFSCILVTTILGAPAVARWYPRNRIALGIWGSSGNFKTYTMTYAMGMWGIQYLNGPTLMAGRGSSTINGAMDVFVAAGIMPQGYDDVKIVDKKKDVEGYVQLIHKVMEGFEKIRSRKEGGLRETIQFLSTPIITGEVQPQEASTTARVLGLDWSMKAEQKKIASQILTELGKNKAAIPTVGYHWIKFLHETDEVLGDNFNRYQQDFASKFNDLKFANAGRLSSIYAMLACTWELLEVSPLGEVFTEYRKNFLAALTEAITAQGEQVSAETEGARFIAAVQEMVASNPAIIQSSTTVKSMGNVPVIGKWNPLGLFLIPGPTLDAMDKRGVFDQIPNKQSMTRVLKEMGVLIKGGGRHLQCEASVNGAKIMGWYIKAEALPAIADSKSNLPSAT